MAELAFESQAASFQSRALSLAAHPSAALKAGPGTSHTAGSGGHLTDPEQSVLPFALEVAPSFTEPSGGRALGSRGCVSLRPACQGGCSPGRPACQGGRTGGSPGPGGPAGLCLQDKSMVLCLPEKSTSEMLSSCVRVCLGQVGAHTVWFASYPERPFQSFCSGLPTFCLSAFLF